VEIRQSALEGMGMNRSFWKDKSVFLTGHTGFKGGWMALWLNDMGAIVHGFSLDVSTTPNLFTEAKIESQIASSTIGDIRNAEQLQTAMCSATPDIVIHMAAQPLVRASYVDPVGTYATNVMGTVHLFEAIRKTPTIKAVVNITTDKCYENREWVWPYRENEAMGGHDPYSSSKGCAELVTSAYRRSFLDGVDVQLASARAGNVIGGGDWADDRLIPDFLRALDANQTLVIRSPKAIRPWQHVLEPLSGYLQLAERLYTEGVTYADGWNFGPDDAVSQPVEWIVNHLCSQITGANWQFDQNPQPHEANTLKLDSTKAKTLLGWKPRWNLVNTINKTLEWHNAWKAGGDMTAISLQQIHEYEAAGRNG
jgi:CDP-glucose 4,6-dehydratase